MTEAPETIQYLGRRYTLAECQDLRQTTGERLMRYVYRRGEKELVIDMPIHEERARVKLVPVSEYEQFVEWRKERG